MWFSKRKFLIASTLFLGLSACGFEPVYKEGTAASKLQGAVEFEFQKGRENFVFRERLIERLGNAGPSAPYLLRYKIEISANELVLTSSVEIARYTLSGQVNYELVDQRSGLVVDTAIIASNAAYSATAETFPTDVAEQDARERLVKALADQIMLRLALSAEGWSS